MNLIECVPNVSEGRSPEFLDGLAVELGVARDRRFEPAVARLLAGACGAHTRGDVERGLARRRKREVGGADRRHLDVQVDAVEQRSRDLRLIVLHEARNLAAAERRVVGVAAAAFPRGIFLNRTFGF